MSEIYEYPIALDSTQQNIVLTEELKFRAMTNEDRQRLFGVEYITLNADGRPEKIGPGRRYFGPLQGFVINREFRMFSSNYLLSTTADLAKDVNFAIKLTDHSWSSLYIGYGLGGSAQCVGPSGYFGKSRLQVTEDNLQSIKKNLTAIQRCSQDSKLCLMRDIYIQAISDEPPQNARFIQIITLLEMLLLPEQSSELAFRFAIRLAKLVQHLKLGDARETFEKAKNIYKIRSKLVHTGTAKDIDPHEELTYMYARKLLAAYLHQKDYFTEDFLDKICL